MQLALRPYTTVGVIVVGASLIAVTPVVALNIEQHAVELAAVEDVIDLGGPIEAVGNTLTGAGESLVDSVTNAPASGVEALSAELSSALPSPGDFSGALADGLPSLAAGDIPGFFDPNFWEEFWYALSEVGPSGAYLVLMGAITQLPVIGPILQAFGLFVVWPATLLSWWVWSQIEDFFGIDPYASAAEGLATDLQAVDLGAIDPPGTALGDMALLFSGTAEMDFTTLVQDLNEALDPSALTSILDPSAIAGPESVVDPAAIADVGELMSTGLIPDIGELLSGLIP